MSGWRSEGLGSASGRSARGRGEARLAFHADYVALILPHCWELSTENQFLPTPYDDL